MLSAVPPPMAVNESWIELTAPVEVSWCAIANDGRLLRR